MRTVLAIAVFWFSAASCSESNRVQSDSGRAMLIRQALNAELAAGHCYWKPSPIDTFSTSFFPGVLFHRSSCQREHADTISRVVATDRDGALYLLDSPSGFELLTTRHQPINLFTNQIEAYTGLALSLTGEMDAAARLVRKAEDLPVHVRMSLPPAIRDSLASVIHEEGDLVIVSVTSFDRWMLRKHRVIVRRGRGTITTTSDTLWRAPRVS